MSADRTNRKLMYYVGSEMLYTRYVQERTEGTGGLRGQTPI